MPEQRMGTPAEIFDTSTGQATVRALGELVGNTWRIDANDEKTGKDVGGTSFTTNPPLSPQEAALRTQAWVERSARLVRADKIQSLTPTQFGQSYVISSFS